MDLYGFVCYFLISVDVLLMLLSNGFFFNEYMLMISRYFLVDPLICFLDSRLWHGIMFASSHPTSLGNLPSTYPCCVPVILPGPIFTCSRETFLDWFTRSTTDPNLHLGLFKVSCKSATVV